MINNHILDFKHIKKASFQRFNPQIKIRGKLTLLKTTIVNRHRIILSFYQNHKGKHKKPKINSLDKKATLKK
jgi:hypothetical protein